MKKISFLIAAAMIMQLLFLAPAVSAQSGFGDYTPLAVRYSPEADIYVAAAKNLNNTNYPMKLYTSSDGALWTERKSFSAAKTSYAPSRQILTYWENEKVFVASAANKILYSSDGINWSELASLGNAVVIDSYGEYLGIATYGKIRIYTSLSDYTEVKLGNGNAWGNVLTVGDGIFYISAIQETTTAYAFYVSRGEDGTYSQSPSYPNSIPATLSVAYIPELRSWVNAYGKTTYNNQKNGVNNRKVIFADGTENTEIIISSAYMNKKAFLGTENGSIYYTSAENSLENTTVWQKAEGAEINSKIYAMTAGRNNCLLAVTQDKTYAIMNEDDKFVKYDTGAAVVKLKNSSAEVPALGTSEFHIVPMLVNYLGNEISECVDSVNVKGTLPEGITFEPVTQTVPSSTAGILRISSGVSEGCTVTVVVTKNSEEFELDIDILAESKIEIKGEKSIIVPSWGNSDANETYSVEIYNQKDELMEREGIIKAISLPEGVTFDESSGTLTVPYTASAGTAVLKAVSKAKPTLDNRIEITIEINEPKTVIIDESLSVISVSDKTTVTIPLIAELYNKTGELVSQDALEWSIADINGKEVSSVKINSADRTVEFPAGFSMDAVKLKASAKGYPEVFDEIVSLVLYNDSKKIDADLEYIAGNYNFIGLENDVVLETVGKYGSLITWTSSDESVITNSGAVAAEPHEKNASMTAVLKLGNETRTYVFSVLLNDISNILKNGNLEKGELDPWTSADSETKINTDKVNEGNYSAYIKNSMSQSVTLKKDHWYAASAYIKADTASNAYLSLGNGITFVSGSTAASFKEMSGMYKMSSDIETDFTIGADGAFYADSIKLYDITDKYNEAENAVNTAEESKLKADLDYAYVLVNALVNSNEKTAFSERLNAVAAIEYDGAVLGSYSFVTSAYNSEENILVAAAKNFTDANVPARLYTSFDGGATWQLTLSEPNAKNSIHSDTKQILTYWENKKAFVAVLGSKVYYSYDGKEWTHLSELDTSNGYVVSNGDILFVAGARTGKSATDLSGAYTEIVSKANNDYNAHFVTVSKKGYGFYQTLNVGSSYPTTAYYVSYNTKTEEYECSSYYPGAYGQVSDVKYVEDIEKWILTMSNDPSYRVLTEPSSFSSALTPSQKPATSGYTATLYDNKVLYVATGEGRIFYGNASDVTKVTGWTEVNYSVNPDSAVSSMQKLSNGDILVFTQKDIYLIENKTVTQNQKNYSLGLNEELRIEVPLTGEKTFVFSTHARLYDGTKPPYDIVSVKPKYELPKGISFKSHDNAEEGEPICEFTVSSYAEGGKNIVVNIAVSNGMNIEAEIKVVTETAIDLGGKELIVIPRNGDEDEIFVYNPAVLGQDGEPMDRNISFNVLSVPENIYYDSSAKSFTLTPESGEGTILVKLISKDTPSLTKVAAIKVEPRRAEYLKFDTASSYDITVPYSGSLSVKTPAYVYDQAGIKLKDKVSYELTDEVGNPKEKVYMSGENLCISSEAYDGVVNLSAFADNNRLTDKVMFNLLLSDDRKLYEDYRYVVNSNTFGKMTSNAYLPTAGIYGSTIKYKTSNESVITDGGVITRDYTKNTSAILTVTLMLNDAKLTKTINVVVLKEDNIADNGNVERGTTEGWSSLDSNPLEVTEDSNSGEYALKTTAGASYRLNLANDRTFAATVYVKSASSGKIEMLGGNDKLAEISASSEYTKIDGIFTIGKNADTEIDIKILGSNVIIDDLTVFEITVEYEQLLNLVSKAEKERTQSAVDAANTALSSFYDLSVKKELKSRIDAVKIKQEGGNIISGGGSVSGGGGSISVPSTPTVSVPDYSEIVEYTALKFKDLNNHWAKDDVEFMAAEGFVNGKDEGVFDPDAYVTRAEFTALLVRTMKMSEKSYENSFFDVVSEDWFSGSVQAARDSGYVMGSNGLFRPNDLITREEMTKMIVSAYNSKVGKTLESGKAVYYSDVYNISSWAYDYIAQAVKEELVNGMTETTFEPKALATRAQAVVMLRRLYNKFDAN